MRKYDAGYEALWQLLGFLILLAVLGLVGWWILSWFGVFWNDHDRIQKVYEYCMNTLHNLDKCKPFLETR